MGLGEGDHRPSVQEVWRSASLSHSRAVVVRYVAGRENTSAIADSDVPPGQESLRYRIPGQYSFIGFWDQVATVHEALELPTINDIPVSDSLRTRYARAKGLERLARDRNRVDQVIARRGRRTPSSGRPLAA